MKSIFAALVVLLLASCGGESPVVHRGALGISCSGVGITFGGVAGPLAGLVISASAWGAPEAPTARAEVEGVNEPIPTSAGLAAGRLWITFETELVIDDTQTIWTELDDGNGEAAERLHDCRLHAAADVSP